ncbi:MAG: peptidase and in, kexin, sedolisin [Bryobacterales bacterium]|nr:peptidase and in, kexin, sedolisin [Bryobacterales bacterium]
MANFKFVRRAALLSLLSGALAAQENRIAATIDHSRTVALKGNVHPSAIPRFDAGAIDPSFTVGPLVLMLRRSDAQQTALDQLLAEQHDPTSPGYHNWLSPEQFADRFGASSDDIAQIVSWLQSEGLTIEEISRARTSIRFSGAAGQVQTALHTEMRRYLVDGELHFANASEPAIPIAVEPVVLGILGLDDFRPIRAGAPNSKRPLYTSGSVHYLAPDDFATIYNLTSLYEAGYDGSGQRIVVAGQSAIDVADVQTFRRNVGLPKNDPQLILVPGSRDPGKTDDQSEGDLDVEWVGAVARNASIVYVYSTNVLFSVIYAVDQNLAPIIAYSYGSCEQRLPLSYMKSSQALAQQANAQGITWVVSSGDSGAAGCDNAFDTANLLASRGLAVSFPASLPEVTGVGGTQFDESGGSYWATSNSRTLSSALSYIPETAWNESGAGGLAASGGGLSVVFPRPSWQSAPGALSADARAVPDIALSSAQHDGYLATSEGKGYIFAGTSAAAPAFAGILALANQYLISNGIQTQPGQGNINPNLYALAGGTSGVFHDVVSGSNSVSCFAFTKDCSAGSMGYSAGPGYDLVTGLGSVDGSNLINNLAARWGSPAIASLNPTSVIVGSGDFTLAVNGTGFAPGSAVLWMGTPLPTVILSGTQLLATVAGSFASSSGSIAITVASGGKTSNAVLLDVRASTSAVFSKQRITTQAPGPGCPDPPAATTVSTTASAVYLYFSATVSASDSLSYDWIAPMGSVLQGFGGSWGQTTGTTCFGGAKLTIKDIPFSPVGSWQVRVFNKGSLLFSVPFTVSAPVPVITSVETAGAGSTIAQNTWIGIKGSNLVMPNIPSTDVFWSNAPEFASGRMPTQVGGVSVKINGKPAYVWFYCSAATSALCTTDQINVLSPFDDKVGAIEVVVTNGTVSSAPFTVNKQSVAPSLLLFNQKYVVATHTNGSLLGPTSLYSGLSTPASPLESVILWAVGFGIPSTALVDGSANQSASMPVFPTCQIGGMTAQVSTAVMISPGLFALFVTVPADAPSGDNPVSCTYQNSTTPAGNLITIQR